MTKINQALCPLCQQENQCGNIASCNTEASCWCRSSEITFPQTLLAKVPDEAKGKACICKECANKRG